MNELGVLCQGSWVRGTILGQLCQVIGSIIMSCNIQSRDLLYTVLQDALVQPIVETWNFLHSANGWDLICKVSLHFSFIFLSNVLSPFRHGRNAPQKNETCLKLPSQARKQRQQSQLLCQIEDKIGDLHIEAKHNNKDAEENYDNSGVPLQSAIWHTMGQSIAASAGTEFCVPSHTVAKDPWAGFWGVSVTKRMFGLIVRIEQHVRLLLMIMTWTTREISIVNT